MIESVEVVVRQPGFPDRVVALQEGASRIGRAEDNELVLSDVGVSRRHAQVYWAGAECLIEDLGSGNGTYHQGRRVQSQPLRDGSEVVIDPFVLSFRVSGSVAVSFEGPSPTSAPARLDVIVGTGMAGSSYPIQAAGLSIGRSEDRDVVIPDPASSRHHCQIVVQGDAYYLRDMGSANGVFINGNRVTDQPLEDGDLVRIGNTEMRFVRYAATGQEYTTQVNPGGAPDPGFGGPHPGAHQGIVPASPPPVAAPAKGSSVWLWLTGLATLATFALLGVLAVVVAGFAFFWEPPPAALPAHPPAWSLDLPGGLKGGTTDQLFESGLDKMKAEDHRGALQDFYRVLQADPSSVGADKFALAAGEALVLEELGTYVAAQAQAAVDRDARRTKLLRDVRRSGRTGRNARAALTEEFREDPLVIAEMKWEPTDEMKARQKASKDAATQVAAEDYADAAENYSRVLAGSTDRDERLQALNGLKSCRRELSRAIAKDWREGVMAHATGDDAAVTLAFDRVRATDPANPCATMQPR